MNEAAQALETELAATPGRLSGRAIRAQAARRRPPCDGDAKRDQPKTGMQDDNLITEICKGSRNPTQGAPQLRQAALFLPANRQGSRPLAG
jgi:hypothetical protein